ncbi:MAG: aromatic amino acid transport family protein, partial [Chlamydiales bacterium]
STFIALPLLLTIYSFQTIVPSLTIYLRQDGRALRLSIVLGTLSALLVYVLWEAVVLGSMPWSGEHSLEASLIAGKPATQFLGEATGRRYLGVVGDFFAFFALVTSFLGIALGLFDFLADGLKIPRNKWGSVLLGFMIVIPTLLCALSIERIFLLALDTTGGLGDSILNAFIPALMLWVGRYRKKYTSDARIFGGRPLIFLVMCYAAFVFCAEVLSKLGLISLFGL